MGLLEKVFVVVNLVLAVGVCAALGSNLGKVEQQRKQTTKFENQYKKTSKNLNMQTASLKAVQDALDKEKQARLEENTRKDSRIEAQDTEIESLKATIENQNTDLKQCDADLKAANRRADRNADRKDKVESEKKLLLEQIGTLQAKLSKEETAHGADVDLWETKYKTDIKKRDEKIEAQQHTIDLLKPHQDNGNAPAEKIFGRVTEAVPSTQSGGTIVVILTQENSKPAHVGHTFFVYRTAEGKYLGKGKAEAVKNLDKGQQLVTIVVRDAVEAILPGDDASTVLPGSE